MIHKIRGTKSNISLIWWLMSCEEQRDRKVQETEELMAGTTGLEPATSDVTGRRSNQTELRPRVGVTDGLPRITQP